MYRDLWTILLDRTRDGKADSTVVADRTYYDLLDIPAEATEAEIKKAYKRKVSLRSR
jgi:hypothetical protein